MTVMESTGLLFEWFSKKDSFEPQEDLIKLIMVSDTPNRDKASVMASLSDLKGKEIVSEVKLEDRTYWILNRAFSAFPQTVELQPNTALAMAELINNFCNLIQDDTDKCDSTNIVPKDIDNTLLIAHHFIGLTEEKLDE